MKNRIVINPAAFVAVPARAEGIAPRIRQAAIHLLGPNRSQSGPMTTRTTSVALIATTFPLAISFAVKLRSVFRVLGVSGGKAYHERKATRNPNQDKKNTLPCIQTTFYIEINLRYELNLIGGRNYQHWHPFRLFVDWINFGSGPKFRDFHLTWS